MTMPKTAGVVREIGLSPTEMSDTQLERTLAALRDDLPGAPLQYIQRVLPDSKQCECGAAHLRVDAADLDATTRGSLHRLLATPFGDIVREKARRETGVSNIRFGWSGIEYRAPTFVRVVDVYDARQQHVSELCDRTLDNILGAVRKDLSGVMSMCDRSLVDLSVDAVQPGGGVAGREQWKLLIEQVMFAFSTPVRKYIDEYARRRYNGASIGAVNCCIIMSARLPDVAWQRRWFDEQVAQQLTPDC